MRLKTDQEFQQNDIKRLISQYNVEMFSTKRRSGKTFAAGKKKENLKSCCLKVKE